MPSVSRVSRSIVSKNLSLLAIALSAAVAAPSRGQAPIPASQVVAPAYDVVSIKPNKSDSGGMSLTDVAAIFQAKNITVENLVWSSYNLTSEKLIYGLPGWARSDHFDVDAKMVDPDPKQIEKLTVDQRRGMLLAILKDRFHFQAHLETRILPVYDLVIAKGGAKFTGSSDSNKELAAAIAKKNLTHGGMMMSDGELIAGDTPVATLIYSLTGAVGRTVIDKTGLTGTYNFELKWTPEREGQADADNGQADSQGSTSSIFTAVEEQLGLKLQSSKGPVQTLVVDHVEMPSEN
jgi:uncharacterized protein (TIGR03435 family)